MAIGLYPNNGTARLRTRRGPSGKKRLSKPTYFPAPIPRAAETPAAFQAIMHRLGSLMGWRRKV